MDLANRETSRDYANPHRPLLVRAFNKVGRVKPFDVDALIAVAQRKTQSDQFATMAFRGALDALVDSLHHEARLSPMGRFMTAQHIVSALANNLRAGALFAARPELRRKPLARTIMVCGLARSGTTLLQRLIAELPGARSIPAWEAFEPIPEPGPAPLDLRDDPRVARLRTAEKFLRWLSPDMFAVHPMDALAPEEDVIILENVFHSGVSESTYRVPSFARWLEEQDQTAAYEWLADCMRVMSEREDGEFWVLKSPHHLEWLDTVFDVFDRAASSPGFENVTIVQTHRDPVETVPSFCSLVGHGWGIMSDTVEPREVASHWTRKIERMLTRALATRDARDGRGFVDVDYRDLTADPIGTVERLCAQIGLPWSEQTRAHLTRWLADNRQHRFGIHRYAPEDFGLSEAGIAERFKGYRERFI
jgi:LPS sulfotransferase NodH